MTGLELYRARYFEGLRAYVEVRLKVAGRQRVHEFGVRVVDKGKAGALEGLAVGTRLLARGRMSGELYKGFCNVHLYADEVMVDVPCTDVPCTM